jgi:hypothetical protein
MTENKKMTENKNNSTTLGSFPKWDRHGQIMAKHLLLFWYNFGDSNGNSSPYIPKLPFTSFKFSSSFNSHC